MRGIKMKNIKVVVILSGGMDSTTLLYDIINQGYEVYALSFNYGQRHVKELEMAKRTCEKLDIYHKIIDLDNGSMQGSSLTTPAIATPHGRYDEESMKATVVPNRNMIMLSIAAGYAISIKAEKLFYGAHSGDHTIYPDCRPEFINVLAKAIMLADWYQVLLEAPYTNITKGDIVKIGLLLNVPFENTWTCYEGRAIPCGKCGSCQEREKAFKDAVAIDPLIGE
jgi:7-cyano-7-deazaguanine synthase